MEGAVVVLSAERLDGVKAFICAGLAPVISLYLLVAVICVGQGGLHPSTATVWQGSFSFMAVRSLFLVGRPGGLTLVAVGNV